MKFWEYNDKRRRRKPRKKTQLFRTVRKKGLGKKTKTKPKRSKESFSKNSDNYFALTQGLLTVNTFVNTKITSNITFFSLLNCCAIL